MKKYLVTLLFLAACAEHTYDLVPGADGKDGTDGKNGHSLVSVFQSATDVECSTSGSRLDIYLDSDDSLAVSEGDTYQGSLVACNGANGLDGVDGQAGSQGPQGEAGPQGIEGEAGPTGPQGPQGLPGATGAQGPAGSGASISNYTSSSCTNIAGTSYYVKAGSNASIYSHSSCHSSTKVAELTDGHSFWVAAKILAVDNDGDVRVINFN
jgi:hypothetical protein